MASKVLILTATISPPPTAPGMVRLDSTIRLQDYREALCYYVSSLGELIDKIAFIDNSGFNLDELSTEFDSFVKDKKLFFFQTNGNSYPPLYGRCFGEANILDFVMQSKFVDTLASDTIFWKVTGRYKLVNMEAVLRTRPTDTDFYMDLRATRRSRWADMRVFSWTKSGFKSIFADIGPLIREDLRHGRPGEEAAYDVVLSRILDTKVTVCTCFITEPLLDGVRGFDNRNWSTGRQRAVSWLRQRQRSLFKRILF